MQLAARLASRISPENRDRIKSATGVALFHALLGYALITSLGFDLPAAVADELKMFEVAEPPPPPPTRPAAPDRAQAKRARPKDAEGAASPANLRDTPTEIMAPKPEIVIPVPPPVVIAPIAGAGNVARAGAANVPGPGTGSGGQGTGLGSGTQGSGTGGGGGGGARGVRARFLSGEIRDSDYPDAAYDARAGGVVQLSFVVMPNGRVRNCKVTRSSGRADLDSTTCRLIERRFRYRPARDADGKPIAETVRGRHVWEVGPEPPPIDVEPTIPDP